MVLGGYEQQHGRHAFHRKRQVQRPHEPRCEEQVGQTEYEVENQLSPKGRSRRQVLKRWRLAILGPAHLRPPRFAVGATRLNPVYHAADHFADMLDREERIAGPDTMPTAQIGNPSADLMFPSDSERVRSGSARRRS